MKEKIIAAEAMQSTLATNAAASTSSITTPMTVYVGTKHIPYEVKDNELFDPASSHLLREEDGQAVEMKFCSRCNQWHPISDFYKNKHSNDGLTSACKSCTYLKSSNSSDNRVILTKSAPNPDNRSDMDSDRGVHSFLNWLSSHDKEMSEEIKSKDGIINEQNEKITSLKAAIKNQENIIKKQKKELDDMTAQWNRPLTEADYMSILDDDVIPPRMLFSALKKKDKNHIFYYKDTTTGDFRPVVAV